MSRAGQASDDAVDRPTFAPRCLCLDLEVGIDDDRIHRFGAVRADTNAQLTHKSGSLAAALESLDRLAEGAAFLLGHNIVAFDLPHLAAASPGLKLLELPVVDTLRLNPLAFPRNPYHHLVKHYQDGQLKRVQVNDPLLDVGLTLELFRDQSESLAETHRTHPDLVCAWHWLTTREAGSAGTNSFFTKVRGAVRPTDGEAHAAIERLLAGHACMTHGEAAMANAEALGWAFAYALAWLSVAGGNSVMPPWVRHQFPEAGALVKRLREVACADAGCAWCRERHDAS
ncbi:MAG: RecQ family ATP-dependent DNA helicase, partial [Gammaproteobacteria bacterium]|nr:RecQ family ATP-dependent DNA helicase [Gammaproteobacteria bacterium]